MGFSYPLQSAAAMVRFSLNTRVVALTSFVVADLFASVAIVLVITAGY